MKYVVWKVLTLQLEGTHTSLRDIYTCLDLNGLGFKEEKKNNENPKGQFVSQITKFSVRAKEFFLVEKGF